MPVAELCGFVLIQAKMDAQRNVAVLQSVGERLKELNMPCHVTHVPVCGNCDLQVTSKILNLARLHRQSMVRLGSRCRRRALDGVEAAHLVGLRIAALREITCVARRSRE